MSLNYYTDDEDAGVVSEYRSMRDVLTRRTPPADRSVAFSPTDPTDPTDTTDHSPASSPTDPTDTTDTTPSSSILDTDGPRGGYTAQQLLRSVVYLSVGAACVAVGGCVLYATLASCF
jgi:hypothetical protein